MSFFKFQAVWFLLLVFLVATNVFAAKPYQAPLAPSLSEEIHIVFDLDWTIFSNAPDTRPVNLTRVYWSEGKAYRLQDYVEEVMQALSKNPRVKISFMSGGVHERNVTLLKQVKLPDGRSLYDLAYRVLAFDDLTDLYPEVPQVQMKFTEKYKKNIEKISKDINQVIIVEDVKDFVLPHQRNSVLHLGNTYEVFESYAEAKALHATTPDRPYVPASLRDWRRDRFRILGAYEVMVQSIEEFESQKAVPGKTLVNIMQEKTQLNRLEMAKRGMRRLHREGLCRSLAEQIYLLSY